MGRVLLVVVIVTAVAFGVAAFIHPDGMQGALGMLGVSGGGSPVLGGAGGSPGASPHSAANNASRTLGKADAEYDAGRFDKALLLYTSVAATAPSPSLRDRAKRSGQRSTLAHALIEGVRSPTETGASARRTRLGELKSRARTSNDEADWLAALRYAASIGASEELSPLVRGALSTAVTVGPVCAALTEAGNRGGGAARRAVYEAMAAHGLVPGIVGNGSTPIQPVTLRHPDDPDDGPSGIGTSTGGGGLPRVDVPPAMLIRGDFSSAMRKKLERGVDAEREGLQHFKASGAEGTDRKEHRRAAYRLLREAQGIFDDASMEDNTSKSLEGHISRVTRALALLRKEMSPDEIR